MKRLVVACDGTWVNSDEGFERESWLPWDSNGKLANPSNVTRICRALLPVDENVEQVVYYQGGLGTAGGNFTSWVLGGVLGEGISENIREAYVFLCNNYEKGDEIFLIGFSRGAFTARSIGGLIGAIGLLNKRALGSFYPVFLDWENQMNDNWVPRIETDEWPIKGRPSLNKDAKEGSKEYVNQLKLKGLTRPIIPIKAVAVFDTVGTLGVPEVKIAGIPVHTVTKKEYAFVNTEVAPNVEHAYHALAIDEQRAPFGPTVWESPKAADRTNRNELTLRQCWFPGVHSSIGGGYDDSSISDITLAWMMTQLSPLLKFDTTYIDAQRQQNQQYYPKAKLNTQPWGMGQILRSDLGFTNAISGRVPRTPGSYHTMDPISGQATSTLLRETCEFMHRSVRYRITQQGPGVSSSPTDLVGQGIYYPNSMLPKEAWQWCEPGKANWDTSLFPDDPDAAKWDDWGKWVIKRADGSFVYIVEDRIVPGTPEMKLLEGWGEAVTARVLP